MKRASKKSVSIHSRASVMIAAAVTATVATSSLAPAATVTWTGAVADPNSATYTVTTQGSQVGFVSGQNLYLWNTSVANWSGAPNYSVGDDVIFTDNFAGGTDIRLPSSGMSPASITFTHIAGATPTNYRFINSTGTLGRADFFTDGTQTANLGTNQIWAAGSSGTLTLDTGFLGRVFFRQRNSNAMASGNTIVRSGILEVGDGTELPNSGNSNTPSVELAGGELWINCNTQGNTEPGSGQLAGTLTVSENSVLASNDQDGRSRIWAGPINVAASKVLTFKYVGPTNDPANRYLRTTANMRDSDGTYRLEDGPAGAGSTSLHLGGANAESASAIWDLGTGSSTLLTRDIANANMDLGALTGGVNTQLRGSFNNASVNTWTIGARGDNTTFAGTITDGVAVGATTAITKVGTGTLTLTNANTLTAATTASGGVLELSGANGAVASSAVTINSGGTFRIDNATNNNNRLGDGLALTMNQGTLVFNGNLASPTAEIAGALTISGGSNVVQTTATGVGGPASLTFASLSRTAGVVDFQPAAGVNVALTSSTLTNGILGAHATANLNDWATVSGANVAAYAGYTSNTAPGTWVAADNINLTTGGTSTVAASTTINSLRLAGSGTTVSISAAQTLNLGTGGLLATGTGGGTISGSGTLTAGAAAAELIVTVPSASNTLTISAPIADNGGGAVTLVKAGAGKLLLSGTGSTYTGGTQLIGGTLQVGVANFFPAGSNLTINYGTSFDIGGFNQSFGTVALIDGSLLNSGGAASVSAATYDVRKGTVSAVIGGSGALTKTTADTVTLTAVNTYTGGTTITGGTLAAGVANALPAGQAVSVNSGGTLDIGAFNQSVGTVTIGTTTNAGNITGTTGVLTGTSYDAQNGTVSAILGGVGVGLTKAGINTTVTLNGANTYTGATTIVSSANSGTLAINTLANGGVASSIGASSNAAANFVIGGGSVVSYTGTGSSTDRLFTLDGTVQIQSNGTGPISFTNTGTVVASGGILTLAGSNTGANTFAPVLDANIGGLTKGGAGTWIVTGNHTHGGPTNIGGGATSVLSVPVLADGGVASPLGASSNAAVNLVLNNGTLRYTGTGHSTDRLFSLNNSSSLDASGTGVANFTNTGAMGGPGTALTLTFTGTNTGDNTFAATIGFLTSVAKTGAGTWRLTGSHTYTGTTTVSGGRLKLTKDLTTSSSVTVNETGTLELSSDSTAARVIQAATVTVSNSGRIDLKDNKLITQSDDGTWNGSEYTGIRGYVQDGRGNAAAPFWEGTHGIVTSMSDATTSILTGIAVGTGAEVKGIAETATAIWGGRTINGASTLVMYTWGGDAEMDGDLDGDDYFWIDSNVGLSGTSFGYHQGDFDYDGDIDGDDYFIIDSNIGIAATLPDFPAGAGAGGGGLAAVPEPGSLGVLAVVASGLLARRRRRNNQ